MQLCAFIKLEEHIFSVVACTYVQSWFYYPCEFLPVIICLMQVIKAPKLNPNLNISNKRAQKVPIFLFTKSYPKLSSQGYKHTHTFLKEFLNQSLNTNTMCLRKKTNLFGFTELALFPQNIKKSASVQKPASSKLCVKNFGNDFVVREPFQTPCITTPLSFTVIFIQYREKKVIIF